MYRFLEYTVGQFMTHPVQTVTPHISLVAANGQLLGIIAREDILRALKNATQAD